MTRAESFLGMCQHRAMRRIGVLVLVALAAAACGDDAPSGDGSAPESSTTSSPTTVVAAEPAVDVAEVRLRGQLASVGDGPIRVCARATPIGCFRSIPVPELTWEAVDAEPRDELWGRWLDEPVTVDGVLRSDGSLGLADLAVPPPAAPTGVPCPWLNGDYPTVGGPSYDEVRTAIVDYTLTIGDVLGGERVTDNRRGITIIRVTDDPARHQAALDEIVPGRTCVIQVENSRNELNPIRDRLADLWERFGEMGYGTSSVHTDTTENIVVVRLEQIDQRIWADIGADAALVSVSALIEVLDAEVGVLDQVTFAVPEPDQDRLVTSCSGVPVAPAAFDEPADDHLDDHPSNAVFDQSEMPGVADAPADAGWRRVYESPNHVLLVADPGPIAVSVRGSGDVWGWAGSGGCVLSMTDPLGLSIAPWRLDPEAETDPEEIAVLVSNAECSSGQPPGDRILPPVVAESDESVVVTIFVEPVTGDQDCQGSPPSPYTIVLDRPLADRELLDGGQYPPAPVG